MNNHTPGPWNATEFNPVTGDIDDCYLYVEPGIAVIERKVKGRDQHDTANARLLAAAPDLLEALEKLLADFESAIHNEYDGTHVLNGILAEVDYARAAIAKAGGEA